MFQEIRDLMRSKIGWRVINSMTKYILDSNAFIAPYNDYYRMPLFPSFWQWYKAEIVKQNSDILLPKCVYTELKNGNDDLSQWVDNNLKSIIYDENNSPVVWRNYAKVISYISNGSYKNSAVANWKQVGKADPLLIAIAMTLDDGKIVTFERRSGNFIRDANNNVVLKNRHNPIGKEPKIPDVADQFNVSCIDLFDLEEDLKLQL